MYKINAYMNEELNETTYETKLDNGLSVYICKKPGYKKKIGLFGTKYGSVINDFVDIQTKERIQVPDGIAHFLEHKLFEKEGANALDLFSKIGVSSNAYTTFDHTVYYFETCEKFQESIRLLVKLIKEPYFTDENVVKEQGIIGQEIMMGDDDPEYKVYFNSLKAMYQKNNVKIDIAGTVDSISHINKELLYTCYNTFYNLNNMFFVVVGDVDIESTIRLIEDSVNSYSNITIKEDVEVFHHEEPTEINEKEIVEKMDIYLPQIYLAYKLKVAKKEEIIKNALVADIVSQMYFSKMSGFFNEEYNKGVLVENPVLVYEGSSSFSYILLGAQTLKLEEYKKDILEYIERIKKEEVNEELFTTIKNSKIGSLVIEDDNLNSCYRRVIDSILTQTEVYEDVKILNDLTKEDVKIFLNYMTEKNRIVSVIDTKNK
ncbi:MAG: pitrilysin family protein [Clostridia bacterium]|nr:pitrilysin family protein [Clostridia bacterium]